MNQYYTFECANRHKKTVSASEIEEILEYKLCPICEKDIINVDPSEILVECSLCSFGEYTNWEEVSGWFIDSCPNCSRHGFNQSMHIVGSFFYETDLYENVRKYNNLDKLKRKKRPDYWEVVTHYCNRDELISILKDGKIKASPTGYFGHRGVSAVCLSEVPITYSKEIRDIHGKYGIVFRKRQILESGGQPVIHMTDLLIEKQKQHGFSEQLKPFVQLIRIPSIAGNKKSRRVDYLYEREWRVGSDIDLSQTVPIGLVLPSNQSYEKFSGTDWGILLKAAYTYGEVDLEN